MKNKMNELRNVATALLASDDSNDEALKQWRNNVRDLLQELSVYYYELEQQNAALEESERNLFEARAKYAELFEEAPIGYVVIDRDKIITQVNRTFNEMVVPSYPVANDIRGHKFDDIICPEYQDAFQRFFKTLTHSSSIQFCEIKIRNRFGQPIFVAISAGKRHLGVELFLLAITNINTRKRIALESRTVTEEEKENDRKKTALLTNISHELRTPLATIAGFSEMLAESIPDSNTRQKYVRPIQNAVQILQQLTEEIQDISFLQSGMVPLRNINIDVASICREQIMIAEHSIHNKDVFLHCDLPEIPVLSGDPLRLGSVLHFILKHAVSNISQGEIRLTGQYLPKMHGMGTLVLDISGNHIFPEKREETEFSDQNEVLPESDGIGPFLATQILNVMKGHFSRTSNLLHLEFPFLKSPAPAVPDQVKTDPIDGQGPKTCLLIDDVLMNLKVLAALMRKINYIPILTTSGKEAFALLSSTKIDLIMTDLWMPEMNGMEFAMNVRQMSQYNHIPIIAVTADVERDKNFDMRYFNDTLIKPVALAVLQEKLPSLYDQGLNNGAK